MREKKRTAKDPKRMEPKKTTSLEEIAPPVDAESFPIVGVGASAGGLQALVQLLEALPPSPGIAIVIIQHLAAESESLLADILQQKTPLPVRQVSDEPTVKVNHIYVIPPDRTMLIEEGTLKLIPREHNRKPHMSVDAFLRSLAENQTHRAVGVILSGTGSDGTLGMMAVKAEGGLTFAQDETAQQDGMPRSAIRAGCVDFVLPPEKIAKELVRIGKHPYLAKVDRQADSNQQGVQKVIRLLKDRTGVDFTNYRMSTLLRRISRRMLLVKLDALDEYVKVLLSDDREVTALYTDILISVTSFFRDPQAHESLKANVFPQLIRSGKRSEPFRVWVTGCSTGEEAYSLAMAITEYAEEQKLAITAQIFSTDLNEACINHSRLGHYSKNIVQDVSPERLERFFIETEEGYQISKSIRDMCIFAKQNVLTDPPFSNISLISCRNMLIYMEPILQKRVLPLFHYAIKPNGYLWLGSSETIGSFSDLFDVVDSKHRVYRKSLATTQLAPGSFTAPIWDRGRTEKPKRSSSQDHVSMDGFSEADRIALNRYAPPGVIVNENLEILQFRGNTSPFLSAAPGRPSTSLLKMARQDMLISLRLAVQKAVKENRVIFKEGVQSADGKSTDIEVIPVKTSSTKERNYLVLFLNRPNDQPAPQIFEPASPPPEAEGDYERLHQELEATREFLQAMVEQQGAANEELQSANEEIQSSNEELQSINEEVQTSKEEIQSTNEELNTVNDELRHRNEQLNLANSDLTNVLSGIHQPLVVLGRDLSIRRYTPLAERMFNLIPSDVGRPITDVKFNVGPVDLESLVRNVITNVSILEQEVQDRDGKWFSLHVRPYRTLDNLIDGALLVLIDIDAQKRLLIATETAKEYAEVVVANVPTPLLVLDTKLHVITASEAFYEAFGVTEVDTVGESIFALGNGQWNLPGLRTLLSEIVPEKRALYNFEVDHTFEHIGQRCMLLNAKMVIPNTENLILLTIQDITDRVRAREAVAEADRLKDEFLAILSHELRNPLSALMYSLDLAGIEEGGDGSLAVMPRQVKRLIRLVDDLLDVSRITRGAMPLSREVVDLRQPVEHGIESCRHQADSKLQQLEVSLPDEPVLVLADADRIEQVVGNVLTNAFKFTPPEGKITLLLQASIDGFAELRISDNGMGLPQELLPQLFDLFVQGDDSLTREQTGQGIGLALVRRLVELHRGTVIAASEGPGKGSTFTIRIPLAHELTSTAPESAPTSTPARLAPLNFLLIDDSPDNVDLLALLLQAHGHQATPVYSGEEGLKAAASGDFDIVVTDLAMGAMDGCEVTRRLRKMVIPRQPVIILQTGYSRLKCEADALAAGCDDLIMKPAPWEDLVQLAQDLMTRAQTKK